MKNALTLAALIAIGTPALAQEDEVVSFGRALAESNCASCHAIGREDESAHPEAVPFRELSERYPIDALEEAFAEGIQVGHPDMPMFQAEPDQIEAILAYIETVQ
ncbi:c-type cytochrome [Aureimonas populi]|uniref:C-type cytochrome n=1 Tax=Aureimonas populi TaxID=1701758 RepID=A0ABW5CIH7_9HYPH|nr:cytochrome c [Aureimonas populi]